MTDDLTPAAPGRAVDESDGQTHRFSYDGSEPQSVGMAIIQAVSSVAAVDALSLEPRLYDVIDPDALERLVSNDRTESLVQVSFEFGQHLVTITNNDELIVEPTTSDQ